MQVHTGSGIRLTFFCKNRNPSANGDTTMRKLLIALAILIAPVAARAVETQVQIRQNLGRVLERHGFTGGDEQYVLKYMALAKVYSTAALRDASTPDVGSVGYAIDDASFKWYSSGGWQAVTLTAGGNATVTGVTYANGGVDRSTAAALAIGATNATSVVVTPPMSYKLRLIAGGASYLVAYATDCGGVVTTATDNHVLSLPVITVASAGCSIELINLAADGAALATVTPGTGDGIKGICGSVEMDGTANKSILNTKDTQKLGDRIKIFSTGTAGAAGWIIQSCSGVFARQT
jgi:hypothetical protein